MKSGLIFQSFEQCLFSFFFFRRGGGAKKDAIIVTLMMILVRYILILYNISLFLERVEAASGPRTGWWTAIKSWFYPGKNGQLVYSDIWQKLNEDHVNFPLATLYRTEMKQ